MKIIKVTDPKLIEQAIETLNNGGIVIYPTETCYGIAIDPTNQTAVSNLLKYKARREGKPISIAVSDKKMAQDYAEINEIAENLYDNYLPGPITVVSKVKNSLADGIASEYGTIGIRIPDYPLVLNLIKNFGKPITATSANVSYKSPPYNIEKLLEDLPQKQKDLIDLIIDAGQLTKNDPSTVVDTTFNSVNVMRSGKINFDQNQEVILEGTTQNTDETIAFGAALILRFLNTLKDKTLVIALGGDLGAGKTQLTKGIGKQLRINQIIKSPTFNLVNEYKYKLDKLEGFLIHIDTWRLNNIKELEKLDLQNYIKSGNIIVIEWADKFYKELVDYFNKKEVDLIKVSLEHQSENSRKIKVFR